MGWESGGRWRTALIDAAHVSGFFVALLALWVAIATMLETQDQVENLIQVVNNTEKTLVSLNTAIREIQHQTIVNAYVAGAPFDIKLQGCSKEELWDSDRNYEGRYLVLWPIIISEDNDAQSIVPFRVFFNFDFYGNSKQLEDRYEYIERVDLQTFSYFIPDEPTIMPQLRIDKILENAKQLGYSNVRIDMHYSLGAFSPIMNTPLAYVDDKPTRVFAKLSLNNNGEWEVLDLRDEVMCY